MVTCYFCLWQPVVEYVSLVLHVNEDIMIVKQLIIFLEFCITLNNCTAVMKQECTRTIVISLK
jgi:hypothetical protein